jgi:hypothetical protein
MLTLFNGKIIPVNHMNIEEAEQGKEILYWGISELTKKKMCALYTPVVGFPYATLHQLQK